MDYQLVIKLWRKSLEDESLIPIIQSELKKVLGDAAAFDGCDVSDNEFNLFVITPDPKHSFRRIKRVLDDRGIVQGVSAAFRLMGGANFTSIWPSRPMRKFKLPESKG